MRVYFHTLGCKVNQYETELLRQKIIESGHTVSESPSAADALIVNSCTVTAQSDKKVRQLLRRLRRENPFGVIALCGCLPQAPGFEADEIPEADIICGNENKQRLPKLLEEYMKNAERAVEIPPLQRRYPDESLEAFPDKTRAIIKVQDGCDMFCSYCVIPHTRGRSRSKTPDKIFDEAKGLVEAGHRELVVVGINLSDYGNGTEFNLADAVEAVCKSGAQRVRLGSLEPEELTGEIISRLALFENLCPHFHLALQSGCDKTLREMRRRYDKAYYFTLVNTLREAFPGCAITTDIMVGFPGETESDFLESLEFVKQIAFTDAHVFPFSPREGTPAAARTDLVPANIAEKRARLMSEAVKECGDEFRRSMVGSIQKVLFEREKSPDFHQGHTANYQVVKVKCFTDTLFREMRDVKITGLDDEYLTGEIIIKDNT